jgi:hypothetical protein
MKLEKLELRTDLVTSLNQLIKESEEIFLSFAKEYPNLLREVEKNLSRNKQVLACYEDHSRSGCQDLQDTSADLSGAIQSSELTIQATVEFLTSMESGDQKLFQELESGITGLEDLNDRIHHIKDDSEEMELISLNAMTVALKAGNSGRAFSYITEELKRLSARIIELTDTVTGQGISIGQKFNQLKIAMGDLQKFQQKIFEEVNINTLERFHDFTHGISQVMTELSKLSHESEEVKKPLAKIMEETQTQDIIRQSLEHVIISIEELKQLEKLSDKEALLDEITFFCLMPQLCTSVLEEIRGTIKKSQETIQRELKKATECIAETDKKRDQMVHVFLNSRGDGSKNLSRLHETAAQSLLGMTMELQEIIARKHTLGNSTVNMLREIETLNNTFSQFDSLILRFKTIDVASRIEIAKNQVLGKMISTANEMTQLTQRISEHVERSSGITADFLKKSKKTIFSLQDQFAVEEAKVRSQESLLTQKLKDLQQGTDSLNDMVRGFSFFNSAFHDLFHRSSSNFQRLETLLVIISTVTTKLKEIQDEAERARNQLMTEIGLSEWSVKNEKLQSIIQRFTIFSHKKAAGDLAGFEVESGMDAGEVTLF